MRARRPARIDGQPAHFAPFASLPSVGDCLGPPPNPAQKTAWIFCETLDWRLTPVRSVIRINTYRITVTIGADGAMQGRDRPPFRSIGG